MWRWKIGSTVQCITEKNKEWNNLCRFIHKSVASSLSPLFKLHIILSSDSSGEQ